MFILRHYEVREGQPHEAEEHIIANDSDTELEHGIAPMVFDQQVNFF